MMNHRSTLMLAATLFVADLNAANWPEWRGAGRTGVAEEPALPTSWSAEANVRWKVALPGPGNSTPVIWEDRVFLTQAVEGEHQRLLMCLDKATGKLLWQKGTVYADPEKTHETNPQCSASPATDGERVVTWFGSAGVFCHDMEGKELWRRDLGKHEHNWGYASSPILHKDLAILHFGPGERAFMVALNKKTGETVWQMDIPQVDPEVRTDGFAGRKGGMIGSWSTPIVVKAGGREELVISLASRLLGLDPATGKELWSCDGLNPLVYTSPIYGEGTVVAMGGFRGTTIAVTPGGNGDVTKTHRKWMTPQTENRLGSGVIHDGHVYVLNMTGIAECLDLATGKSIWKERFRGRAAKNDSWSNLVLANGLLYGLNQSGETIVAKASPNFEIVSINSLTGDMTNSSLAVSDGLVFIRTHAHLWCVGSTTRTAAK